MKPLLNSFTIDLVEKESKSIRKQLVARCAVHDCFGGLQTYARCEFECECKCKVYRRSIDRIHISHSGNRDDGGSTDCMHE